MINQTPDIRIITMAKIHTFVNFYPSWKEKSDDTDDVVKSKNIKFDPLKFKTFTEEFKTLLSSIRGVRGITLEYVVRTTNVKIGPPEEVPKPDVMGNDSLALMATLTGPDYERDNSNVFTILRVILTSTMAWNVISPFSSKRNGRQAYMALKEHFQGSSYFDLMKTQATTLMTKTSFHGDRPKFAWENYVAVHMDAHELFSQAGEDISESMKILNIKNGIRSSALLENTIEAARTSPTSNATF